MSEDIAKAVSGIIADVAKKLDARPIRMKQSAVQRAIQSIQTPPSPEEIHRKDPIYLRFRQIAAEARERK